MTLCVTSNLREMHFRLDLNLQFYETDFMQVVSTVYDPSNINSSYVK
jgi:hypothetical protein